MYATVIEFNALADTVWPTAKDNHLIYRLGIGFTLIFVRRVHVGSRRRKLARAGIDPLVDRSHIQIMSSRAQFDLTDAKQVRQPNI